MRFVLCSILFLLIYSSGIAAAGEEQQINEMLKNGGNVHLNSGIYNIDGPIIIGSNTVLTGEPDTVIRVDPNSGQWYTSSTGIITLPAGSHDISISGFQIDGNCENIAREYANYAGKHDAERLIFLQGSAGAFSDNISIHDMVLHDAYSDGIHLGFCTQANCYNNFISDTQHEGIFYVNVLSGSMHDNKIASITSDGLRCDNCQNVGSQVLCDWCF